jgi:hypothetical protein
MAVRIAIEPWPDVRLGGEAGPLNWRPFAIVSHAWREDRVEQRRPAKSRKAEGDVLGDGQIPNEFDTAGTSARAARKP